MRRYLVLTIVLGCGLFVAQARAGDTPAETVKESEQVLGELVGIPGREIPQRLLSSAPRAWR